jgi:hypothetical protein
MFQARIAALVSLRAVSKNTTTLYLQRRLVTLLQLVTLEAVQVLVVRHSLEGRLVWRAKKRGES